MRNSSFFDLDEDSTIVSLLTVREPHRQGRQSGGLPVLKILLGCAMLLLVYALLRH